MLHLRSCHSNPGTITHQWFVPIAAACFAVLISGCALFSTPSRAAIAYLDANNRRDYIEARKYITDADLALLPPQPVTTDPFRDKSPNERAMFRFLQQNRTFRVVSFTTNGKTSDVTVSWTEPGFSAVSDAVTSNELMDKSESEVMQYLNEHKADFGREEGEQYALHLKREHDGWKVFLDIKGHNEKERKEAARKAALLKEYADKLEIRNVEAGYYESNGTYYIKGEVKNAGTKTIRYLEVKIVGLNDAGKAVFEKDEVLVQDYLYPNDSADIFLLPEDPPADWNQTVKITVLSIDFF